MVENTESDQEEGGGAINLGSVFRLQLRVDILFTLGQFCQPISPEEKAIREGLL